MLLGVTNSCAPLEAALTALKKAAARTALTSCQQLSNIALLAWGTYLEQLWYRHACLLLAYSAIRDAMLEAFAVPSPMSVPNGPAHVSSGPDHQLGNAGHASAGTDLIGGPLPPVSAAQGLEDVRASSAPGANTAQTSISPTRPMVAESLVAFLSSEGVHVQAGSDPASHTSVLSAAQGLLNRPAQIAYSEAPMERVPDSGATGDASLPSAAVACPAGDFPVKQYSLQQLAERIAGEPGPVSNLERALRRWQRKGALNAASVLLTSATALLGSVTKAGRTAREGAWKDIATPASIAQIGQMQASLLALLARCACCSVCVCVEGGGSCSSARCGAPSNKGFWSHSKWIDLSEHMDAISGGR
jgi:hypothetical protein